MSGTMGAVLYVIKEWEYDGFQPIRVADYGGGGAGGSAGGRVGRAGVEVRVGGPGGGPLFCA